MDRLRFHVNGRLVEEAGVSPTTTLLAYLRERLHLSGTKEGCAEGDCGACTVAVLDPAANGGPRWRAVNSCLVLLPMVQGRKVVTVEGLAGPGGPHPAQHVLVKHLGSQCGYCTPGVVMSMVEAAYRKDLAEPWQLDDQLCGNLCRCTGYRPIKDAAREVAGTCPPGPLAELLASPATGSAALSYEHGAQRFFNPVSLGELFDVLGRNPGARIVCGGTDLSLEVTKRFAEPPLLVSVEHVPELRRLERRADGWSFGAACTLAELGEAIGREMPALDKMIRFFASRQIKNRASLGGNLCTASPIGDLAPVLLALGASVTLRSAKGARELPLERFFLSYRKTALEPGEVLQSVEVPHLPPGARASSYKVSKRRELDISAVSAGFYVRLDSEGRVTEARLAYGGMGPTPARARRTEEALLGRPLDRATVEAIRDRLDEDFRPISDHRGSAWYRGTVAKNLLIGFFLETREHGAPRLLDRPSSTIHLGGAR